MAISARLQFNKSDERNKATDIAEMGITYYKSVLDRLTAAANTTAQNSTDSYKNSHKNATQTDLNNWYDSSFLASVKGNNELKIGYKQLNTIETDKTYTVTFTSLDESNANYIVVNFTSKGQTAKDTVTLSGKITIQKTAAKGKIGQTAPASTSFSLTESNPVALTAQNKDATYTSSTYFTNDIQIQGNRSLTVQGDAFIGKSLYLQGSANVTISGDAIFQSPMDDPTGNAYNLCISGDTYLVNAQNKLINYPLPTNSCANTAIRGWGIDSNSGINVQY
ncbi:MAG: hypothetical protein Q8898_13410 [Bacillota bacterium]|nr:hypothetical protein [Bacillota bacterium]